MRLLKVKTLMEELKGMEVKALPLHCSRAIHRDRLLVWRSYTLRAW